MNLRNTLLAIGAVAALQQQAFCQNAPASSRPAFSPYLNLNRNGQDPAINYYGLVRPQISFMNSIQKLQVQQGALSLEQQQIVNNEGVAPTGHRTGFMNASKYFMNQSAGAQVATRVGGAAPKSSGKGPR